MVGTALDLTSDFSSGELDHSDGYWLTPSPVSVSNSILRFTFHGCQIEHFAIPSQPWGTGIVRIAMGDHCYSLLRHRRARSAAHPRRSRRWWSDLASVWALLGIFQHVLWSGKLGLDLRSLWELQRSHFRFYQAILFWLPRVVIFVYWSWAWTNRYLLLILV